ncbi:hypothetical protein GLYMA_08G125800v4 [Glycine max]|uniref:Receptor-like serine/threonine-protein kinase n=5 Tax=Glycine subgen. Soja TaxID=1462606 RepID=K7L698_SOYBN|nr:G-type lectin S-receptor-like serine/threonine-protein kinase CES101 isoform X2 [Glycine max]KRH43022.1 hypothetical protein GLYMA_08G125800v4 [Glycine max]RZB96593.1 G-type lectin S-receptor-like serine/threonine-protein kinase CES101 isoform A [Glycine soja]
MVICYKQLGEYHFFLVLLLISVQCVIAANNILKPGDTLNTRSQLCSENNIYCMDFSPLNTNPIVNYTHLSISDNRKDDNSAVWVANRNQPVDKHSAVLMLNHSGVLKIESSKDAKPIILFSSPQPLNNNNTEAKLLDTGNFVVQQLHPNGTNTVLWQSFDYPTDTLLPGMKLGVNHKTGHNWSLVSWLAVSDPRIGAFRFEWEPIRRELIIKERGRLSWTSGELRNNNGSIHNTKYTIVSNDDESYFTITTTSSNEQELIMWEVLETGRLIDRNKEAIARADMCYGYNTDGGCQKWEEIPTCRHSGDAFETREVYVSMNMLNNLGNSSYGPSDCRDICWENCACNGYRNYYDGGTGCTFLHWNSTEEANFASGGETFHILVNNTHHKGTKKWIWITVAVVVPFVICAFILFLALKKRKHLFEEKKRNRMETGMLDSAIKDLEDEFKKRQNLKVFKYTSVLSATNDFSPENKLGQGGFGPVYKGILPTGQEAAIKRLSKTSRQGVVEFKNELMLICELQHMNLVQLLGCCIHEEERILIYEYMPNKSLDFYLFDCTRSKLLDWKKRFNIIEGISQGLLYLHKYSRLKVIHRDLKASNILLDENMNPKISDFGLARMFEEQESTTTTSRIIGTYGYMSPEYAMEGIVSVKSDVYSFGVLVLEIISGRRNTSFNDDRPMNLIGHAWELWNQGVPLQLMDPSLNDLFDLNEVTRCIHIGLICVEKYANDRPTMSQIISMLTNESVVVPLPRKPAFYVEREILLRKASSKELCTNSTDEITIT